MLSLFAIHCCQALHAASVMSSKDLYTLFFKDLSFITSQTFLVYGQRKAQDLALYANSNFYTNTFMELFAQKKEKERLLLEDVQILR